MTQVDLTTLDDGAVFRMMMSATNTDEELYNRCVRELNRRHGNDEDGMSERMYREEARMARRMARAERGW